MFHRLSERPEPNLCPYSLSFFHILYFQYHFRLTSLKSGSDHLLLASFIKIVIFILHANNVSISIIVSITNSVMMIKTIFAKYSRISVGIMPNRVLRANWFICSECNWKHATVQIPCPLVTLIKQNKNKPVIRTLST